MSEPILTPAKRRLLEHLKQAGPSKASEIAAALSLTDVAVRQHLTALSAADMVAATTAPAVGRGRPATVWSLTEASRAWFPDRHGELAASLVGHVRAALGDDGLKAVLAARTATQVDQYRTTLDRHDDLRSRLGALARLRTEEGYMAEVVEDEPGRYLLVEHHCPICDAARACVGLCASELEVFQRVLGPEVQVERTRHLLQEGDRCVYRVEPSAGGST